MTTEIEAVPAPSGADKDKYQFFKDVKTGQLWKAAIDLRHAQGTMLGQADIEAAPAQLAIGVTVSPTERDGSALREAGKPIIIDTFVHTFTDEEMQASDFDPKGRILSIIAERVHVGKSRLKGLAAIRDLVKNWEENNLEFAGKTSYDPSKELRSGLGGPMEPEEIKGVTLHRSTDPRAGPQAEPLEEK